MARDDLRAVHDAMEPPWDDLREQRVLRGVRTGRVTRQRRRRTLQVAAACAAVIVVLGAGAAWGSWHRGEIASAPGDAPAPGATVQGSVLSLADGSRLLVQDHADVRVESQTPTEVRLVQRAGEVHYDVKHDPGRSFEVHAASVRIRVKGTAFRVLVDPDSVLVHVDRGVVAVDDDSGSTELTAGEELRRARRAAAAKVGSASSSEASATESAPAVAPVAPSVEELLARADQARASGRLDEAAAALQGILTTHPRDKRIGSVLFTLGKVERARGNHAAAVAHFRACSRGPLAEDALAEEAGSWLAAGQPAQAKDAAQRYLARFPAGPYVERMKRIAGQ